jgi:glycosyltransferase involved in cell wall biosynthesis
VTTRATGCIDAVIDGQTGLIVEIGDTVGLQKAVETLILSPSLRQTYSTAAEKRIVECFDAQLLVDEHLKLYQSLVDNKKDSLNGKKE